MNSSTIKNNNITNINMDFKGNPIYGGKLSKKYLNFIKKNPNAPVPSKLLNKTALKKGELKLLKRYSDKGLDIINNKITFYVSDIKKEVSNLYTNQEYDQEVNIDLEKLGIKGFQKLLSSLRAGERFIIKSTPVFGVPTVYFTLNDANKDIIERIIDKQDPPSGQPQESDYESVKEVLTRKSFTIKRLRPTKKDSGAFFKWTIKHHLPDVDRYGIHTRVDKNNYTENCFIKALILSGKVKPDSIERLKINIKSSYLPINKIKEIALNNDLYITVKRLKDTSNLCKYGNKENPHIKLGLIEEHYFLIEKTKITSFSINNFEKVKNKKDFQTYKKINERTKTDFIDSYKLIKLLIENKETFLEPIINCDELFQTPYYNKIKTINATEIDYDLDIQEDLREELQAKIEKHNSIKYYNIFFDFETNVYIEGKAHEPYLCWAVSDDFEQQFIGKECGKKMLIFLYKRFIGTDIKIKLIAHNAGYDFRTGIFKYLSQVNTIEKGSSLLTATAKFYNYSKLPLDIVVSDSYSLISSPLRNFGKLFPNIKQEKEVMPYVLYNTENIEKRYIHKTKCLEYVKVKDQEKFLYNCKKWKCLEGDYVDIISYSSYYCRIDCLVLKEGYEIFRDQILTVTELDINHFITIASIADNYLIKVGCYDNCVSMGGTVRKFIQKCLVGGRTMLNNNKKTKRKGRIADYDAVSLYPSAMNRLEGFLQGKPKLLKNLSYDFLRTVDGYFIKIKVLDIKIKRDFPLLSYINDDGIRIFSNDMKDKEVFIDRYSLEDAIKFQGLTFEIIEGYYFDEGFNTKINETIKYLFEQRLKAKKSKNPIQSIYKLLMNSSYGKTALKEINEDVKYVSNKNFDTYLNRNYNWIKEIVETENQQGYRIKLCKSINTHFNRVHIGIQILSMSKRIMNEVMCLAEDNKIKMFYQDTDSIHLYQKDVKPLEDNYRKMYNRELNGKNMGQFHVDFDLDGCKDIYSEKFIGLGKKSYLDCLVGTDIKTGETKRGYHIRMKGVPNDSILYEVEKRNTSLENLYDHLYYGNSIVFDLLKCPNGDKVRFKNNKNMTITTLSTFERQVQYK
jgi:hypothetical protein